MQAKEITFVEIAGRQIAAVLIICPKCKTLDLNTTFNTNVDPWTAHCPLGHEWTIPNDSN